jgi:hypothetical protein
MSCDIAIHTAQFKVLAGVILSRTAMETSWAQKGPSSMDILDMIADVMGSNAFLLFAYGCIAIFFIAQIVGK